jgi:hypothetical protein
MSFVPTGTDLAVKLLSKAILNRVCAFAQQGRGLRVFPYAKGINFPAPPSCTIATCDVIGVLIHHVRPLNLLLPMVRNVMCCWWRESHYSLSEIRTLKIWWRRKSLGCGAAYQPLPRSPTSKIHGLSWEPLLYTPQGVRRSSTTSPRVWRGCHWGGLLAIGIARFTVTPLVWGFLHGISMLWLSICSQEEILYF